MDSFIQTYTYTHTHIMSSQPWKLTCAEQMACHSAFLTCATGLSGFKDYEESRKVDSDGRGTRTAAVHDAFHDKLDRCNKQFYKCITTPLPK